MTAFSQDSKWWSVDFTPTSSPDGEDIESEDDEEEEEEGELDSVGRLFLQLINNEVPNKDTSTDNPANFIPGPTDPVSEIAPGPQATAAPTQKRTRATIAKVPYSHFSVYMMNSSQT